MVCLNVAVGVIVEENHWTIGIIRIFITCPAHLFSNIHKYVGTYICLQADQKFPEYSHQPCVRKTYPLLNSIPKTLHFYSVFGIEVVSFLDMNVLSVL